MAVISGLARGIDGAAHEGALAAGPTWGVMGSGLDHPYPPEHRPLMDRMVAAGGGVLTPFPPQAPPLRWHFPRRNWLLAAWTQGVLVTEARLKSGSLVTARLALDLGKELWVCPGGPFGRRPKLFVKRRRRKDLPIPSQPPGGPFCPTGHLTKVCQ